MIFNNSKILQKKSHELIPGGCHTYAKGDDQYPDMAPGFIARGKGCHVWDVDGNEYIEYGMGLRSVTLGHAYDSVNNAAIAQMKLGHNFVRPAPIEIECAESFLDLITGAEMVKFGKNGSDATNAAVRLARAYTGRDMIAICKDHPFFSVEDWFIGNTVMAAGIPKAVKDLTVGFHYNDLESLEQLFDSFPDQIACVIMEPEKDVLPEKDFLQSVKNLCEKKGTVLIFDEMICGFRWHNGGGQAFHGVFPHLSAFGKAMGNGFAVSALAGIRELMELGGINHTRERVFLLSLTHGAENPNLAAALEVMKIYKTEPVIETLWRRGEQLAEGIRRSIDFHGLNDFFSLIGRPCCMVYSTRDHEKKSSQPFRTLFLQEIIKRGILAPSLIVSYSHTENDIDQTIEAVHEALAVYAAALETGVEKYLKGPSVKPVFRPFC
jgi:glutamate-1-semialdehyde 2,1-aminomutase